MSRLRLLLAAGCALAAAGCAAAPAATAPSPAVSEAGSVPAGWTTVTTPDSQALAFRCDLAGQAVTVTAWNISAVTEQAWHLAVIFSGPGGAETRSGTSDIGDQYIAPQQKMSFRLTDLAAHPGDASCQVAALP